MLTCFSFIVAFLCMVQCRALDEDSDTKLETLTPLTTNRIEPLAACTRNLDGYIPSPAIGAAHKIHTWKLQWNNARRTCYDEGGQLAVINSNTERDIILRMMEKRKVETVWLGIHDLFEKGDWTTVTGIPLPATGFSGWGEGEPNNVNSEEHCGELSTAGPGGMNDNDCSTLRPFICKIQIPVQN